MGVGVNSEPRGVIGLGRGFFGSSEYAIERDQIIHVGLPGAIEQAEQILMPIAWRVTRAGSLLKQQGDFRQASADHQLLARAA